MWGSATGGMRGRAWARRRAEVYTLSGCMLACPLLALGLPPFGSYSLAPGARFGPSTPSPRPYGRGLAGGSIPPRCTASCRHALPSTGVYLYPLSQSISTHPHIRTFMISSSSSAALLLFLVLRHFGHIASGTYSPFECSLRLPLPPSVTSHHIT